MHGWPFYCRLRTTWRVTGWISNFDAMFSVFSGEG